MHVMILGDGEEERAWAAWLSGRPEHRLDAAYPGFPDESMAGIPAPRDLQDALARPGVEAIIVGGPSEPRGEWLRRAAAEGYAIIALHPPGPDSEAFYQVALSREETGAVIVPDLPLRLHPGVQALRRAFAAGDLGSFRVLRLEAASHPAATSLVRVAFTRAVDAIRAILGEIDALTATGDPPGGDPSFELVVQLRAAGPLRAEARIRSESAASTRLTLLGEFGSLSLDVEAHRLALKRGESETPIELPPWDPHGAIMAVLTASTGRRESGQPPSPNLLDGTRAMELSEAVNRSLRRGRTVELHYESISEESTFKSVMTSSGCLVFLAALFVLPLAMAGAAIGLKWALYIPYLIPPALVLFVVLQALRPAIRRPTRPGRTTKSPGDESARERTPAESNL
jgi:myo-inositol 2-dehydrogenase/D-chiro-inositol 1-dehydrogenase